MCSQIGVCTFEICADAPAVAGPESASNIETRTRDHLLKMRQSPLNLVGVRVRVRVQRTNQIYLNTTDRYKYNDNAHVLDAL